ncbi:DUF2510 domain-containing protein [uncultured Actinomyces sp.]|uniref:DUF2510 domain-containing protein n=1 Tax=uncultured Actinomyces sp. TaxID=249061 RepID=UPI0028F0F003|nr:DUF2510 domain-containing protein [uncultured Actinomyces sp.]
MSQPAPGWYPDPAGTQRLRWWNGGMWLDQYQPMPGAAPQQGLPAQHNAPAQQGFPAQHNAPAQQGFPAQQAAPAPGPHMPSAQQAPTVSADPYHASGTTPAFGQSDTGMSGATAPAASTSSSSGKGWRIGTAVAWALTVVFAVTAVYTGTLFARAGNELSDAQSEQTSAQQELDQAKSDLDQAKKELEEAQK